MSLKLSVDTSDFIRDLKNHVHTVEERAVGVVKTSAREGVNFARGYTAGTKPGVHAGEGDRKIHPGGWGDVSSNLVTSIKTGKVKITASSISQEFGVMTSIDGSMEYAAELDERDGYSVLAGAPEAARKALNKNKHKIV